jgi:WD40 repeat protein
VNCDGSLIAIAVADDIFIYDTIKFVQAFVCKGHVSDVDVLAFQPGNPKVLVSSAQNDYGGLPPTDPTVIVWDLDVQQARPMMEASVILSIASQATETVVENLLYTQPPLELSAADEKRLTEAIAPVISRIVKTHNVANQRTLYGRLQSSFQSDIFSPSGAHLIYLPSPQPKSNDSDVWDIKIYSMSTHENILTLTGHTDALMWAGYSPDETMIGTVAWDKSMGIWDAKCGHQKYKFNTEGQNWTGGFSPNSELFAGTCGDGTFYIHSMRDGVMLIAHRSGHIWMRALS